MGVWKGRWKLQQTGNGATALAQFTQTRSRKQLATAWTTTAMGWQMSASQTRAGKTNQTSTSTLSLFTIFPKLRAGFLENFSNNKYKSYFCACSISKNSLLHFSHRNFII